MDMLTGDQISDFAEVVGNAFSNVEFKLLLLKSGKDFKDYAPTGNVSYTDQVTEVVLRANSDGWLLLLIRETFKHRDTKPVLDDFFQKYPDIISSSQSKYYTDPYEAEWLDNGKVFLGRKAFRKHVRLCRTTTGPRGFIINQDPNVMGKCGKSFSKEFINFLADKQGLNQRIVYINLDDFDYTFLELAKQITDDIGLDRIHLPVQDGEQPTRWARRLARWILNESRKLHHDGCWIIIDGFRIRAVYQDTYAFIDHLVEAAFFDQKHARIVLINFNKDAKECNSKQYEGLFIDLASPPSQSDMYEFFSKILPSDNQEPEGRKQTISEIVSQIVAQTEEQDKKDINHKLSYYDWLNIAIVKAARALSTA